MFAQCTRLKAKQAFSFKTQGAKGRPMNVRVGDLFWITSSMNEHKAMITIARIHQNMSEGKPFEKHLITEYFDIQNKGA